MSIWASVSNRWRGAVLCRGMDELLQSLTPYERDCMFKVHYQVADREPVDPLAKRVIDEAVDRFNAKWKTKCELEIHTWLRSREPCLRIQIPAGIKDVR